MNIFYETVLPSEGPYCCVGLGNGRRQTFHSTIEELIAAGDAHSQAGNNAYFAPASFKTTASRESANVAHLRTVFVDIDISTPEKTKNYPDVHTALVALKDFIVRATLPNPYIVLSGGGIHAYWVLDREVSLVDWSPRAHGFRSLCRTHGLSIDPSITIDAARILRMPGTLNYKYTPPAPVELVESIAPGVLTVAYLDTLIPEQTDLSAARAYGPDTLTSSLARADFPPTVFARLVRKSLKGTGCAQIARAVQDAETLEEPLWRAALSIAQRCTDAEEAIHVLSRGHPEYDREKTIRKAQGTAGPMTCQWYKDNYPETCRGCAHIISSPIMLGRKIEEAPTVNDTYVIAHPIGDGSGETVQVEVPVYPFPYFRGAKGGVWLRTKDKEGEAIEIEVYRYDLYLRARYYDYTADGEGEGEVVEVNLHTPHDGIRRFIAPVTHLLTREKMRDLLLMHGVIAIFKELDLIMAYFAASLRGLQRQFAADRTRNQMGWTPDEAGFVVGEREYTVAGTRLAPASSTTRMIAPYLTQRGSLDEWVKVAQFYATPGLEPHALAIGFAFGSPLLRLTNNLDVRGAVINLMSNRSGTGKTTAQMMCNSIWGHPHQLLSKKSDTVMAKMQLLGMLNNIAMTMDEITNMSDEDVSEFIYDVPQGRGRHRMESQSNRLRVNSTTWTAFVISSSNSSLYDKLGRLKSTADGEMRRLVELRVNRPLDISKETSDEIFGKLSTNYGTAGPVFIQFVLHNKDKVRDRIETTRRRIDREFSFTQSDRFMSMLLACCFVGLEIAIQLKLFPVDFDRLYAYAKQEVGGIQQTVLNPMNDPGVIARETLVQYINDNITNALVVNAKSVNGIPAAPIREPKGPLRIRYEPDTKELWIPAAAMRDYFVNRQVDFHSALAALAASHYLKSGVTAVNKRIAAGGIGGFGAGALRCYCFNGDAMGVDVSEFATE